MLPKKVLVFDLDDTLYPERSFEASGIEHCLRYFLPTISDSEVNSFVKDRKHWVQRLRKLAIVKGKDISVNMILDKYHTHFPQIQLYPDARDFLDSYRLEFPMSLITDGRSNTQRMKLAALGISDIFNPIVISEEIGSTKPAMRNFMAIEEKYPGSIKYYFADNVGKDFVTPNKLGWRTYCLVDRGSNVHDQNVKVPDSYLPMYYAISFEHIVI